jgi:hypothetical protein
MNLKRVSFLNSWKKVYMKITSFEILIKIQNLWPNPLHPSVVKTPHYQYLRG